jgi:hypothetical protein
MPMHAHVPAASRRCLRPHAAGSGHTPAAAVRLVRSRFCVCVSPPLRRRERTHIVLNRIEILPRGVPAVEKIFRPERPVKVGPQFGLLKARRQRVAHIDHDREVEELCGVELVLQPACIRPAVLVEHACDRPPLRRLVSDRGSAGLDDREVVQRGSLAASPRRLLADEIALMAAIITPTSGTITIRNSTKRNSSPTRPGCPSSVSPHAHRGRRTPRRRGT